MPIIPMRQEITVIKPGGRDKWNQPMPGVEYTYRAHVMETVDTVANQYGEEVVTTLRIYIDKLPDISYDDAIRYVNELGVTVERKPVRIEPKRMVGGKPLLTVVYV